MFYTYIIYSLAIDQYYFGHTENLEDRLYRHRNSGSKSTKKANDWDLQFSEGFETRSEAASNAKKYNLKRRNSYVN